MKKTSLILSMLVVICYCFGQTKEINFEKTSFSEIKAKAKKENKLIFMDAYTSWCGPCKWMAANVFTNDTVADYFNAKFINAKFDMEKGEGEDIAKLYEVHCYPNLLFIDGEGKLIHRGAGGLNVEKFIQLAEEAFNPKKRFSKYKDEYPLKKTDPVFLREYVEAVSKTCLSTDAPVQDYFKTQKDEILTNRVNWNMIRDYSSNYKSREFTYLLSNVEKYNKEYTADSVNSKIKEVFLNEGYSTIYKKESKPEDYKAYIDEIKKIKFAAFEEVLFKLDLAYSKKNGDWQKYVDLSVEKGDKYFNFDDYNNISWDIYEHSDNKEALQKAESWMLKAVKETPDWYIYDTYAAVLYKLNKKADAKTAATKAIELAKNGGRAEEEYQSTTELLQKIEKLK
jgi:thiol-disulfide isomerase/thioredoxin